MLARPEMAALKAELLAALLDERRTPTHAAAGRRRHDEDADRIRARGYDERDSPRSNPAMCGAGGCLGWRRRMDSIRAGRGGARLLASGAAARRRLVVLLLLWQGYASRRRR